MTRQTSVQLTSATEAQVEALRGRFGTFTDIVRIAVDRMHRDEVGAYRRELVGDRPALAGDTVALRGADDVWYIGRVVQDGCTQSLVQFGNEQEWHDNARLVLVESNARNADYRE